MHTVSKKNDLDVHSVLTDPHPQRSSHLHRAHGAGVLYQGCAGTGIHRRKSLLLVLPNHTKDGHMCADDLQPIKLQYRNLLDYYLKFKGHVMYLKGLP